MEHKLLHNFLQIYKNHFSYILEILKKMIKEQKNFNKRFNCHLFNIYIFHKNCILPQKVIQNIIHLLFLSNYIHYILTQ